MKQLLLFISLLFLALPNQAQELDSLWEPTQANSFGSNVRIRQSPDLTAPVVGKLQMGELVDVYLMTREWTEIGGLSQPWVKVRTEAGQEGFVWAGLMAHRGEWAAFPKPEEGLLMLGFVIEGESHRWALRQITEGKLLAEIPLSGEGLERDHSWCTLDYRSTEMELVEPEGFEPAMTLIMVTEGVCACRCASHTAIYTWDGQSAKYLGQFSSEGDAGYANSSFGDWSMEYPAPNQLVMTQTINTYNEEDEGPVEVTTEATTYQWDGHQLVIQTK